MSNASKVEKKEKVVSALYEMFETDVTKEEAGVTVGIGKNSDGTIPTFTIAAMYKSNKRYMKALERITKEYKAELASETLTNAQAEEINMKTFVDTVLLHWENVQGRDGAVVPFSKKAALALFTDLPRLYDLLTERAQKMATFKAASLDTDGGN